MKILFFDTETTGLPKNWKAPVHQLDNWPRLVQIAWQVYDSNGNLLEEHDYVIRPVGFIIPTGASAVHKITTEKAFETGVDLLTILKVFSSSVKSCGLMVAHNYSYDYNIIGSELLRNGLENILKDKEHICTMNASTDFCKIPGPYGYKWPKLEELHYILFSELFNAHNALDDIKATARCFWELLSLKVIMIPKVKISKKSDYYNPTDFEAISRLESKIAQITHQYNQSADPPPFDITQWEDSEWLLETYFKYTGMELSNVWQIILLEALLNDGRYSEMHSSIKASQSFSRIEPFAYNLAQIQKVKEIHDLKHLDLSQNRLFEISPLEKLTNLTSLRLSYTKITDISPLKKLTNLTSLDLGGNQITDISPLEKHVNFKNYRF